MEIHRITDQKDWQHARHIRERVFIVEQDCPPEEEWDEHDWPAAHCAHLLGMIEGDAIATARWRPVEFDGRPAAKLERFAVLPMHRGEGLGRLLIAATIDDARQAGYERLVLHAQAHLEALYASFGFRRVGEVFDEAGIPHVKMVREEDNPAS